MNKRILIFTDNYPYGKSEPFLENELKYIDHSFERISLFPIEIGMDKNKREISEKIEILKPPFNEIRKKTDLLFKGIFNVSTCALLIREGINSGVWKSWTRFRNWGTHLLIIRSLLYEIRHRELINYFNQFDILYFYWGLRWSQIIPFLPENIKPKIIVRFHGSDLYEHTNNGYIPWRYQQLNRINSAIAISNTGKIYIEDQYPFMKGKIFTSGIGTKDYGLNPYIKSDIFRIVSCSNLVPLKRVDLIVKTLRLLKIKTTWVHYGDGTEMSSIKTLAEKMPDHIKTEIKGAVRHDELMNYFRTTSIDLFINVSSSEGLPVSIMEAMSFGIPVIATNVGGTSEIVSEKTGLLIDKKISPASLANNIEELANRTDLYMLRRAAREEWEKRLIEDKVYPDFISHLLSL